MAPKPESTAISVTPTIRGPPPGTGTSPLEKERGPSATAPHSHTPRTRSTATVRETNTAKTNRDTERDGNLLTKREGKGLLVN